MPPREIFPNPKYVKALTSKSEVHANELRAFMPSDTFFDSGETPPGYERRQPTETEQHLMRQAEQFLDETFRFFSLTTPAISFPSICILQKKDEDTGTAPFSETILGNIDMHSQITLASFRPQLPDGARTFLHIALHEFTHAKSKNLWTIGRKTTRRTSGFDRIMEHVHVDSSETSKLISQEHLFVALNEAMTETLTVLTCESILASPWFQETYGEDEEKTKMQRDEFCIANTIYDAEIAASFQDSNGEMHHAVSYKNVRIVLSFLFARIAQHHTIPRQDVFRFFVQDYAEGTMERIKPLLRATFGPDILRVLSVWMPGEIENDQSIIDYLKEKDPNIRDIIANNYLTKRGSLPQMS